MCRPMFHVREVDSATSEVLRSSSLHALVMSEALAYGRTVPSSRPLRAPLTAYEFRGR